MSNGPRGSAGSNTGRLALPFFELLLWPSLAFVYIFAVLRLGDLDYIMADYFAAADNRGFPLRHDFWTEIVLHDSAQTLIKGILVLTILFWLVSLFRKQLSSWRRVLGYIVLASLLSVGIVNAGKRLSNVDCPWDLQDFGGSRQYHDLFAGRTVGQPPGRCFPGGHSSSGFALLCLFFVARRRGYRHAGKVLSAVVLLGGVFAVDQWARGAHFPSHDITTAYLCWLVALLLDHVMFGREAQQPGRQSARANHDTGP